MAERGLPSASDGLAGQDAAQDQPGSWNARSLRTRAGLLVQVLCLVYAAFVFVENVGHGLWIMRLDPATGTIGADLVEPPRHSGQVIVSHLDPGEPMARAGVAVGDEVRFDRPYDLIRRIHAGEPVGFTLEHAGHARRVLATADAAKPKPPSALQTASLAYTVATALAALFGTFIVWRSRRNPTTMLLGMGLVTYGLISINPPSWLSAPALFPMAYLIGAANLTVIPILFYAFAMRFYADHVAPLKAWEKLGFGAFALVQALGGALSGLAPFNIAGFPAVGDSDILLTVWSFLGFGLCLAYLALGWRRSAAAVQQRYALMLVATVAIMLSQSMDYLFQDATAPAVLMVHYLANSVLTGVVASGLFAYAILRHKVFDLGFAVNRTLVYGVVSAILLAAFGVIEWAVDHFLPVGGREKNLLVDAVVAVGVFLTFHRMRDTVEHSIERLFFHRWQQAETALRQFVKEAPFATRSETLTRGFTAALTRFAEGAEAAIYLRENGAYQRIDGAIAGMSERIDPDDAALMAIRADPRPAPPDPALSRVRAALVAPMLNRNEVTGVVLLGPKPSGFDFRPDEVELIGWAARQVGLDLHTLKVEALEAAQLAQSQQIALLSARLEGVLTGRQPA